MKTKYFEGPHWEQRGSGYYCRFCGYEISPCPEDIRAHKLIHKATLEFRDVRGFLPLTGEEQEEQKASAWRRIRSADVTVRVASALQIAEAYYSRDVRRSFFCDVPLEQIPTMDHYLSAYDFGQVLEKDPDAEALIRRRYPAWAKCETYRSYGLNWSQSLHS